MNFKNIGEETINIDFISSIRAIFVGKTNGFGEDKLRYDIEVKLITKEVVHSKGHERPLNGDSRNIRDIFIEMRPELENDFIQKHLRGDR